MSLRPFEATVLLPSRRQITYDRDAEGGSVLGDEDHLGTQLSCTPQSFPASPSSRSAVLADFSDFTQDVLYRARDELRATRPAASGASSSKADRRIRLATFCATDAHPDIALSCGLHCAAKVGKGLYRTVRSGLAIALPFDHREAVYFEMLVQQQEQQQEQDHAVHGDEHPESTAPTAVVPPSLCIGVSSKALALNAMVGSDDDSVGLHSSGNLVRGSVWRDAACYTRSCGAAFCSGSIVGVLCHVAQHRSDGSRCIAVRFFVDGNAIEGLPKKALNLELAAGAELHPTLSLYSPSTKVYCHFAAGDISYAARDMLPSLTRLPVRALDGSLLD